MDSAHHNYSLLLVRTKDGARHVVRALLSQVGGCAIEGDLRYNSTTLALPDQSVALHAARVALDSCLKLGSLDTFEFNAPIPPAWGEFFGMDQDSIVLDVDPGLPS
jgi:23S rRNA-/tRNA-specific pseudouridylate synthase